MFSEYKDILTVSDVCKALDIGKNQCYDLLKQNKIKSIKIGKAYKIPKKYLIEFITSNIS